MITYAQNFEDVILERIFKGKTDGFYIDVGAWDPVTDSVTKHFYDRGWSGINIDPVRAQWELFQRDRPRDINLNIAVGEKEEKIKFYEFSGAGYSTFRSDYREAVAKIGETYSEVSVDVYPLRDVCLTHVTREIDFLKIDVEGWEGPVIVGADWKKFRPTVVLIESTWPNSSRDVSAEWEPALLSAGYVFVWFDGLNRFYVREESSSLKSVFEVPVNVFDEAKPHGWVLAERERNALRETNAQLNLDLQKIYSSRCWRFTSLFRKWSEGRKKTA